MSNLKKIKKGLKKEHSWKKYKNVFQHKQMRLVYSYVVLLFEKNVDVKKIVSSEIALAKSNKGPKMFIEIFSNLSSRSKTKIDWDSFGRFMWFQYQTSTYWKDVKKERKNIFNRDNYIEMNSIKRKYWQNWVSSLDNGDKNFNSIITSVMRKVF